MFTFNVLLIKPVAALTRQDEQFLHHIGPAQVRARVRIAVALLHGQTYRVAQSAVSTHIVQYEVQRAAQDSFYLENAVTAVAQVVDGVYDSDPKINPDAKMFHELDYIEVIQRQLNVMDSTAISLCMDNHIPIVVFNIDKPGNILKAAKGEDIGTLVGGKK